MHFSADVIENRMTARYRFWRVVPLLSRVLENSEGLCHWSIWSLKRLFDGTVKTMVVVIPGFCSGLNLMFSNLFVMTEQGFVSHEVRMWNVLWDSLFSFWSHPDAKDPEMTNCLSSHRSQLINHKQKSVVSWPPAASWGSCVDQIFIELRLIETFMGRSWESF